MMNLDNPSGCQHVGRRRARRSRVLLPLAVVYLVSLAAAGWLAWGAK